MIAANPTSSSDVRLIKATFTSPSIYVSSYGFEGALSGVSTNLVSGAFFKKGQSTAYILGKTKSFNGNLMQAFTNDVGFIMEIDYLLLGA
jgi:hypothetical protein